MQIGKDRYLNFANPFFWILLVILFGAVLRSIAYFGATSMWLDEVASAMNIQTRDFHQLATEKLNFNQVAPLGFLWLSKLAALIFGETDEAYRLPAYLSSLVSLPLFYLVAKRFLSNWYLFAAVAMFSLSYSTFVYAFQAKQYSGDLATCLFISWTVMRIGEGHVSRIEKWVMGVGGSIGLLISFQAVPIATFAGLVLLVHLQKQKRLAELRSFIPVIIASVLAASITIWFALSYNNNVKSEMSAYWSNGYPTGNGVEYFLWFPKAFFRELGFFLAWFMADMMIAVQTAALLLLLFSIPGIIFLKNKTGYKTLILFSTLIVALLLAITHQYPFANRVSFYASFAWIISGMAGLQAVAVRRPLKTIRYTTTLIAVLIGFIASLHMIIVPLLRPPYYTQPMQPLLKELKKRLQPGDIIYVYHKARFAMQFYGAREGITDYLVAKGDTTVVPILRDADKLKGNKRVWFIFTQWTPGQQFPDSIKTYLGSVIGKQVDSIPDPFGLKWDLEAAAHLYDLSGSSLEKR